MAGPATTDGEDEMECIWAIIIVIVAVVALIRWDSRNEPGIQVEEKHSGTKH